MRDINRIEIRGKVGQDAAGRAVGERTVINFSVAVNRSYKDRNGEWQTDVTWFNVTAWQGPNIVDVELLRKGAKVSVIGEMRCRKWTDEHNIAHESWEINAEQVEVIQPQQRQEARQQQAQGQQYQQPQQSTGSRLPSYLNSISDDGKGDLPF